MTDLHLEILDEKQLLNLAVTKVLAISRRGEWKDYVDVYFMLTQVGLSIDKIINETKERFGGEFSEKLFWEQLVYWDDIANFEIEYIDKEVPREEIQTYFSELTKKRLEMI